MNSNNPSRQRFNSGFTLLEIMIAVLIMAIGLAAMANLQGKLTRYSTVAKQRTIAMNLVEQQVETMRSFYTMQDTGADACSTEQNGFDDLESCADGTSVSVGNMQFTLSWTVDAYAQNRDGTTEVFSDQTGALRADLKLVTINVSWVDGLGDAQNVELVDIIDATSIFNTGRVSAKVDSNTPPKVPFNPEDFPGVVEIELGAEKFKGSTTPKPTIFNKGENVVTKFDVVTFLTTDNDSYLQRREEFKVVNCVCTLDAGTGTGRAPTIWDGTYYALGEELTKRTGSISASLRGQPAECEVCCNDHHDPSADAIAAVLVNRDFQNDPDDPDDFDDTVFKYDNFRAAFSGDAGQFDLSGDHAHYKIEDGVKLLAVEGDDYLEACRFIRKDGLFKLTTDLSQENLDVFRESYPTTFNQQYSTSVINFATAFSEAVDLLYYPGVLPGVTYSVPWWLDWWGIFLGNMGVVQPAMSRGIYIDYMGADLLKKIKCLQAGGVGSYSEFCDLQKDPPWLEILPFFDVDVTSLANWNRGASAISVTNSPISDIDSTSFSRGEVEIAEQYDIDTTVSSSIELSNTGLTDTNPIDPDDEFENSEEMPVRVRIGGSPPASGVLVLGNIYAGSTKVNVETVRIAQTSPVISCEIVTAVVSNVASKSYYCDLTPVPASGTVTVSDYNALKVLPSSTEILNRKVCTDSTAYSTVQVLDEGVVADPDLSVPGERTVFTFSGLSADATLHITIEEQADACP